MNHYTYATTSFPSLDHSTLTHNRRHNAEVQIYGEKLQIFWVIWRKFKIPHSHLGFRSHSGHTDFARDARWTSRNMLQECWARTTKWTFKRQASTWSCKIGASASYSFGRVSLCTLGRQLNVVIPDTLGMSTDIKWKQTTISTNRVDSHFICNNLIKYSSTLTICFLVE